ncbi:MAG: cell wall hydrolase [Clostridia bacterium]|nr:cell wall hydrolase [Clostridia bacterium]
MRKNKKGIRILTAAVTVGLLLSAPIVSVGATDNDSYEVAYSAEAVQGSTRSSIPAGAYMINVNVNGRQVLNNRVFNTGGVTYVPMFAFADWVGAYEHSYSSVTGTATLTGTNLKVTARAGDYYIVANDRYFYTVGAVLSIGNEIYVPILPMVKALNSHVEWRADMGSFYVRSGDSRLLPTGSQVYNADQVYWLARIISAEAKGEPMQGKIAVGNVVLNRVRSSAYPNTIYGVIFDKRYGIQFAPVANGTIYNTPTVDSMIAAKICLEGYSISNDIIYFVNPQKAPNSWISYNRPYAFTIGNHAFFE